MQQQGNSYDFMYTYMQVSGKTGVPKSGALASESYALSSIDHAEDAAVRMAGRYSYTPRFVTHINCSRRNP